MLGNNIISSDGTACWQIIENTYKLDCANSTRMCPKLSNSHIYPNNFEKMRVCYALQVFSQSCAAAIRSCIQLNKYPENLIEMAKATANTLQKLDALFDCLNSKQQFSANRYKCGLTRENEILPYLKESIKYLQTFKLQYKKANYCILGLIQTIHVVIQLSEDIFESNCVNFILTARLNQDPLENFFAKARSSGGNNKNPTVAEFNSICARLVSIKLVTPTLNTNCQVDDDEILPVNLNEMENKLDVSQIILESTSRLNNENDEIQNLEFNSNESINNPAQNFVHNVIENIPVKQISLRYYVGYVIFNFLKNTNCKTCELRLIKPKDMLSVPSEHLIYNKNYGGSQSFYLKAPSDEFFEISKLHIKCFEEFFPLKMHKNAIKNKIVQRCIQYCNDLVPMWYFEDDTCYQHRLEILNIFIKILLWKNCIWISKTFKNSKVSHKLNIISE